MQRRRPATVTLRWFVTGFAISTGAGAVAAAIGARVRLLPVVIYSIISISISIISISISITSSSIILIVVRPAQGPPAGGRLGVVLPGVFVPFFVVAGNECRRVRHATVVLQRQRQRQRKRKKQQQQ
jgi:hypothetical protein